MATVTLEGDRVRIVISNQEAGLLRAALARGVSDQHDDFKHWLIELESDWVEFVDKQGNNNTLHEKSTPLVMLTEGDAKQLQDLTGEMRESDSSWGSVLDDLDNKLHNIWLRPHDRTPPE